METSSVLLRATEKVSPRGNDNATAGPRRERRVLSIGLDIFPLDSHTVSRFIIVFDIRKNFRIILWSTPAETGAIAKRKVAGGMKAHDGTTERMQRRGGIRRYGALLSAVVFLWAAWAGCAHAATWTVTKDYDYIPYVNCENTLRDIIGKASSGDTVNFADGISEIRLNSELVIDKELNIIGASPTQKITIRQRSQGTGVIHVYSSESVLLQHLTLTGGSVYGGCIDNRGTLVIDHCDIVGNAAYYGGGGVLNREGGKLTIKHSLVKGNSGLCGGGVLNNGTATMIGCVVDGNSADLGGGIYNRGNLLLASCTVLNNAAANGGGIYSEGTTKLMTFCRVQSNTPDQICGSYTTDGTCTIGNKFGTASVAFGGVAHGVSPESRKTTGEADVTVVENNLKNPESAIFAAVKGALSADLGDLPGDVSAGLSGMNATLYNAFTYEDVPLADASGEGELVVEFTASWPQNVRYYAAFAEYEDAAAALAVKGYALPERGVQFEIKPGQSLPDGATPPDFYEEGEGLMTWRNVIADNGPYDHNRQAGLVTFRVCSIRAEARTASSGGSGCSAAAASPFALLPAIPLIFLRKR
jgi:Synergist-CTERM protein sorting domain-containing protein